MRQVSMLISTCDLDGDGHVDRSEWCARFGAALKRLSRESMLTDVADDADDLHVSESQLTPACLEEGVWPSADEWSLSDHGVVSSRFGRRNP